MKLTKKDYKNFKRVVDGAVKLDNVYKQGFNEGRKAEKKKMEETSFICQFCGRRNDNIFKQRNQKQELKK